MGQGLERLLPLASHAYEVHERYRAVLEEAVLGYVVEKNGDVQIILSPDADESILGDLITSPEEYGVGIMKFPDAVLQRCEDDPNYSPYEGSRYFSKKRFRRCA